MLDKIKSFFRKIAAPFLKWWNNLPLRWKGFITTALPITAILISSLFAFFGNRSREAIESDIERKFALVSAFEDVMTLMVNSETGMRGFQITKRTEFLQPYETAKKELPEKMSVLQNLINAEPGEKPRIYKSQLLSEAQDLVNKQMTDLEWQKNHTIKSGELDNELYNHILTGKSYMDSIRKILGRMESHESELLTERIEQINSIRRRDYILVFITLTIALITRIISWYLFDTGIKKRIREAVVKLRKIRKAEEIKEETKVEIDALEDEINYISETPTDFTESGSGKA